MNLFGFLSFPVIKQRFLIMINLSSLVAAVETAEVLASPFLHKVKSLEHLLPMKINVVVQIACSE